MRNLLLFVLAATVAVGCSQESVDELTNSPAVEGRSLVVSLDEEGDETRIQLNEDFKTVWNEGDLVSVFYRSTINEQWQFQGKTGDRTGNILPVDSSIVPPATGNDIVVVYPYNDGYFYNSDTKNVQASLPTEQTYLKDSYGLDGNIMVSSSEYNQITLKSVCGWLKLQLTGAGEEIESITVRGNGGEQLAGELYINTADATSTLASQLTESDDDSEVSGTLVRPGTILTEVTLNCLDGSSPTEKGVALGAEATSFYIALPPQTFAKGLTVEITDTNGLVMTKSTDNEVVIERNHIKPMAVFEVELKATKPANNEIYYTNGSTTEPTAPNKTNAFGDATIQSNTYDVEKECWVITFDKDIKEIGNGAFSVCSKLTSVTIPDSVTTIGYDAFAYCSSLKEFKGKFAADNGRCLIMDNTIIAYAEASGTTYTIPDSVTAIGYVAFRDCNSLTSVTIGDSVTTIGHYAFSYCSSLTSVTIGNSVTTIGNYAFNYCTNLTNVNIPDSVTTIGNGAFADCEGLASVTIPDSVTSIGEDAFEDCESLTSVTIPDSVMTIGDSAFYECRSLTSVTIPDSVTTIGWCAFCDCSSLTSVTIGNSVTTIGNYAFNGCKSLKEFKGKFAADNGRCLIKDNTLIAYAEASGTTYTIPDSVTTIGESAFYECSSLTSVTIPDSVTTIGDYAFGGCESLKEFKGKFAAADGRCLIKDNTLIVYAYASGTTYTIPDSVTTIEGHAFSNCTSLTSVTIPNSITTIGYGAFYGCNSLKTVYCKPTTPPTGGYVMFSYYDDGDDKPIGCKIYVPASDDDSIIKAYKAKQYWSDYASNIFEEE